MQAVRRLYENAVPSVPLAQVQPPQDICICRFTPCGTYLVSFWRAESSPGAGTAPFLFSSLTPSGARRSGIDSAAFSSHNCGNFRHAF